MEVGEKTRDQPAQKCERRDRETYKSKTILRTLLEQNVERDCLQWLRGDIPACVDRQTELRKVIFSSFLKLAPAPCTRLGADTVLVLIAACTMPALRTLELYAPWVLGYVLAAAGGRKECQKKRC